MITLLVTGLLASIIVLLPALLFSDFRSRLGMALRGARKDDSRLAGLTVAAWEVIGYSLIALVASACLVWIQASVLRTFCPLCLVSAVSSVGAAVSLLAADSCRQVSRYQKEEMVPVVNCN
jgi:uncharacterized membrane protein